MRLILSLAMASLSISSSAVAGPRAAFNGTSLVIRDGSVRIVLPNLVDEYSFHETLHSVRRVGDTFYVVYGSGEMSRGWPARNGNCGSGEEVYIRWLKIEDGKVVDQREGLYVSCWKGRDGYSVAWKQRKLVWQTEGWRRSDDVTRPAVSIRLTWTYDPAHPELGIVETEQPTEWQPNKQTSANKAGDDGCTSLLSGSQPGGSSVSTDCRQSPNNMSHEQN